MSGSAGRGGGEWPQEANVAACEGGGMVGWKPSGAGGRGDGTGVGGTGGGSGGGEGRLRRCLCWRGEDAGVVGGDAGS